MAQFPYSTALVIGAGRGISASFAGALAAAGVKVGLASRNVEKLSATESEIGAETMSADATDPEAVARLFDEMELKAGATGCGALQCCSPCPQCDNGP